MLTTRTGSTVADIDRNQALTATQQHIKNTAAGSRITYSTFLVIRFTILWWCMAGVAVATSRSTTTGTLSISVNSSVRRAVGGFCVSPSVERLSFPARSCWWGYHTQQHQHHHQQQRLQTTATSSTFRRSIGGSTGKTSEAGSSAGSTPNTSKWAETTPTTTTMTSGGISTTNHPTSSIQQLPSLSEFLSKQKAKLVDGSDKGQRPSISHVSLGNPAGDADSIISAIALAYIDSMTTPQQTEILPIISISERALRTQRPETKLLLEWAGISLDDLVCLDHPGLEGLVDDCQNQILQLTLVDHNRLDRTANPWLKGDDNPLSVPVIEILDHHLDEKAHLDSCPMNSSCRNIAFQPDATNQPALVASTTTLLVERYLAAGCSLPVMIPTPLSTLLLGVILLDSVNLSEQANKVTERDRAAIQVLMKQTDWEQASNSLLQSSNSLLETYTMSPNSTTTTTTTLRRPHTTKWFDALQGEKFSPAFWSELTVLDCLALDYKSFTSSTNVKFGVATVLTSLEDLLTSKSNVVDQVLDFIKSQEIAVLGIMCATSSADGKLTRELALASTTENATLVDSLVEFLQRSPAAIELEEVTILPQKNDMCSTGSSTPPPPPPTGGGTLKLFTARQHNAGMSRKQVVPILLEYWQQ